jgi:hypothetical protein
MRLNVGLGILLETRRISPPVRTLPDEEYESRIRYHQERVAREMVAAPVLTAQKRVKKNHGVGNFPDWLRVVNCARCNRTLPAKNQPAMPDLHHKKVAYWRRLAVAVRVNDRPYCPHHAPESA